MAALFGIDARISTRCVDKGEQGQLELFGQLHQAQRLAVPFRFAHAEIAQAALFGIAAFLLTQHHARGAVETRQTTDDAQVIGKVAVAMQLDKVGEYFLNVVQRVGALGVPSNFGDLPGRELAVDILGQLQAFFGQLVDFR